MRNLHASVGLLPALHGSGGFYRGNTHILSTITLGGPQDAQLIEGMEVQNHQAFYASLQLSAVFGRRNEAEWAVPGEEKSATALGGKSPDAGFASKERFSLHYRVVSEAMASNAPLLKGSICASSLALMDAGVPIKSPVVNFYGIDDEKRQRIPGLTDIQGFEDHFGDMDFKCAGTKNRIHSDTIGHKSRGAFPWTL